MPSSHSSGPPATGQTSRALMVLGALATVVVVMVLVLGARGPEGPHRDGFGGQRLDVPDGAWVALDGVLSVFDAALHRGELVILDGREDRVHVQGSPQTPLLSFGGAGDGPGELRHSARLTLMGDTVWVADMAGARLDGFTTDGTFVRRIHPRLPCTASVVDDLAAFAGDLYLAVRCFSLTGGDRHLVRVDPGQASTHVLPWPLESSGNLSGDLARLVVAQGQFLVGSLYDPCLYVLPEASRVYACLEAGDRVALAPALLDSLNAHESSRLPFVGPRRSAYYPYYLDATPTSAGLGFVQPDGEDDSVFRVPGHTDAATLRLPGGTLPFLVDRHILLVRGTLEGVHVALVNPLEGTP